MSDLNVDQRLKKLNIIREKVASMDIDTKANESMSSAQAGYGDEFVPSDLASQVMGLVRDSSTILSKLPAPIAMPTNPYTLPVEGADMSWYHTAENTDVAGTPATTSKAATDDIVLTAKKQSASVYASGELDDDSIVNIKAYLAAKFAASYGENIDDIILNGDTETGATGNVNLDDAAPTAGTNWLALDGLRKSALVTNTATANINVGTLDIADIRSMRATMGIKGAQPEKLLMIMDYATYYKILGLGQVETVEKFGLNATIVNGVLLAVDGIEVMVSSQMSKTEADGKVSTTGGNNTLGQIILVYREDVITGFRRDLSIFTEYLPVTDQYRWTAHVRFALAIKAADSVAVGRNITV